MTHVNTKMFIKLIRKYFSIGSLILSILLMILAFNLDSQNYSFSCNLVLGISASLLTAMLIDIVSNKLGLDSISVLFEMFRVFEMAQKTGLDNFSVIDDTKETLNFGVVKEKIRKSHKIDITLVAGDSFFEQVKEDIIHSIKANNCNIRIMLSPIDSIYVKDVKHPYKIGISNNSKNLEQSLITAIGYLEEIKSVLKETRGLKNRKSKMEIKYYACFPTCSIFIVDDYCRISPYLPYLEGSKSFFIDGNINDEKSPFIRCQLSFDRMWEKAYSNTQE